MGIIYETVRYPSTTHYDPEFNADGTEKHIVCEGARFHVLSYSAQGVRCSVKNCEMNRHYSVQTELKHGD
jgi:hypothetical protein